MKIAIVYDLIFPYTKGGAERRVFEIANRLSRKHEVHVFGMKFWKGNNVIKKYGVYYHGVCRSRRLYYKGRRGLLQPIIFSLKLFSHLFKKRFDVIDCQNFPYFPSFTCWLVSKLNKSKLVITWHEVWRDYWYKYIGRLGFFGKIIERLTAGLSKNNITVSNLTKRRLIGLCVKDYNMVLIPNGIDIIEIKKTKKSEEGSDVIFVGRLIKEKNADVLIKAIKLSNKKIKSIIIGDGPERKKLEKLTLKLKLQDKVSFKGFLKNPSDVYAYMKSSKALVLPSSREGFGIVAIEAMACGLPVITVDEKWNAATGLVHEESIVSLSEHKLSSKIKEILKDNGLRKKILHYQNKKIKRFDWDRISEEVLDYYEQAK